MIDDQAMVEYIASKWLALGGVPEQFQRLSERIYQELQHCQTIRVSERDGIVDKLLEAFQNDICPYPPDEPCRNMEMDCVACFREFFESLRKGDPGVSS